MMTDLERQLLQDVHEKVSDIQVSVSVMAERHNAHREAYEKSVDDLEQIKRKVLKVEGAMWLITVIFALVGVALKFFK